MARAGACTRRGGRTRTDLDAVEWARACVARGAGEILLTSIDRDGTRSGYDLELTRAVIAAVDVPVVASGGAGSADDVRDVFAKADADAALVAGILHDGSTSVREIKQLLDASRNSCAGGRMSRMPASIESLASAAKRWRESPGTSRSVTTDRRS